MKAYYPCSRGEGFAPLVVLVALVSCLLLWFFLSSSNRFQNYVEREFASVYGQWQAAGGRLNGTLASPAEQNAAARAFLSLMLLPAGEPAAITTDGITVADQGRLASQIRMRTTNYSLRLAKERDPARFAMTGDGRFVVALPR